MHVSARRKVAHSIFPGWPMNGWINGWRMPQLSLIVLFFFLSVSFPPIPVMQSSSLIQPLPSCYNHEKRPEISHLMVRWYMNLVPDMEAHCDFFLWLAFANWGAGIPCVICSSLTNCQGEDTRVSYGCMSVTDRVSAILFGASGHNWPRIE